VDRFSGETRINDSLFHCFFSLKMLEDFIIYPYLSLGIVNHQTSPYFYRPVPEISSLDSIIRKYNMDKYTWTTSGMYLSISLYFIS